MSELKDGVPTGRLNNDGTMAEVNCYTEGPDGFKMPCGTRWIPVTEEMRKQIQGVSTVSTIRVSPELTAELSNWSSSGSSPGNKTTQAVADEDLRPSERRALAMAQSIEACGTHTAAVDVAAIGVPLSLINDTSLNLSPLFPKGIRTSGNDEPTVALTSEPADRSGVYPRVLVDSAVTVLPPPEDVHTKVAEPAKDDQPPSSYVTVAVPVFCDGTAFVNDDEDLEQDSRQQEENSGGNVNYYCVSIEHPKRPERAPYVFEVEDLIQALNMNFHEGTVLKSLVRSCVERELGMRKKGGDYVRDAEKMVHSSAETLRIRKLRAEKGLK